MRREAVTKILAACAMTVACDAKIPFTNGRRGPPERAAWQVRLAAPGHMDLSVERKDNGAFLHLLVTGPPGAYDVSARISGSSCEGVGGSVPLVDVRTEDASRGRWSIVAGPAAAYVASLVLEDAPGHFDLFFMNALTTDQCHRSIALHSLEIVRKQ
jgi:hypothetical protein